MPVFRFDKAKIVVGFDADFLATWISPVQFTRDYAKAQRSEIRSEGYVAAHTGRVPHVSDRRQCRYAFKLSSAENSGSVVLLLKTLVRKKQSN